MNHQENSCPKLYQRCKYVKIPVKAKLAFFNKVIKDRLSIKEASAMFSINYSTAKTLMRQYKFNTLPFDVAEPDQLHPFSPKREEVDQLRAGYRDINKFEGKVKIEQEMLKPYKSFQLNEVKRQTEESSEKKSFQNSQFSNMKIEMTTILSITIIYLKITIQKILKLLTPSS